MAQTPTGTILQLTPLDHIMPATYTRLLLCFPFTNSSSNTHALIDSLQLGVDNIVSQMPVLAGNLCAQDYAAETNRAHVRYSEASAKVVLKVLDLPSFLGTYQALSSANMPLGELDNGLAPVYTFADPICEACPVFAIQATFIRVGVLLCVCVHHYIMDGTAFGIFLGLLAESCRTAGAFPVPNIHDIQDRSQCLVGLSADEVPNTHPEYQIVDIYVRPALQSTPPALHTMKTRLFQFSAASLAKLKDDITGQLPVKEASSLPSFVSTNDCLTALLWTCVTRSRILHLNSSSETVSRLGMAVNGRRQLSPPLPPAYLGNVNIFATACLPIPSLASPSATDLANVASSIRQAITAIDDHHIRSAISLISAQRNIKSIQYGFKSFLGPDLAVTSWEGMGAYGHDWGCGIGRPEWVRPLTSGNGFDGLAIVLPRKVGKEVVTQQRTLEVMLGLRADDMERLEADEVWRRYCDGIVDR